MTAKRLLALAVCLGVLALAQPSDAAVDAFGEGSDAVDRQQLVYELNLARWNPVAYEAATGVSWTRPLARPPLALDDRLLESSQFKAEEIAHDGYFSHESVTTGVWPNDLVRSVGYDLPPIFKTDKNNLESLHSGSPVVWDVLESFAKSPTHMRHLFGQDWFIEHLDIGVGRSSVENVWAVHTAFADGGGPKLTGVAFDDVDGDAHMDLGEGLAGVRILVDGVETRTNAGGGFAVAVEPGAHTVVAFGPGFSGVSTADVIVADVNVGVDFVSGDATPWIRAYQLCQGLEPTILGTSRDDVIFGTPGDDVIHGLGGRDIIDGAGGNDVICRGPDPIFVDGAAAPDRATSGPW